MERGLPPGRPVTVSTPGQQAPGELLVAGRPPRSAPPPAVRVLALAAAGVLAAGLLVAADARSPEPPPRDRPTAAPAPPAGVTAVATLGAARTDQRYGQRLTLTVVLQPQAGRGDGGSRPPEDEVALVDVRLRGFAVVPDDQRTPIPLGRFGRANVGRATTVPLEAVVSDCSIEPQARREVVLELQTGEGPAEVLRAAVQPELVRALDRVVSRACRRPRG